MIYSLNDIPDEINTFIRREHFHIIIRGDIHTGKSTYLQKLLSEYPFLIPYGFYTKKSIGKCGIQDGLYIHSACIKENERIYSEQNRIVKIANGSYIGTFNTNIFNTLGKQLLTRTVKPNEVAIADEVGFLERNAHDFLNAVSSCFDANRSIIAVFKNKSMSYLDEMLGIKDNLIINVLPDYKFSICFS